MFIPQNYISFALIKSAFLLNYLCLMANEQRDMTAAYIRWALWENISSNINYKNSI